MVRYFYVTDGIITSSQLNPPHIDKQLRQPGRDSPPGTEQILGFKIEYSWREFQFYNLWVC